MKLQDYLQVPLDNINFNEMSVENIIYIIENNKIGGSVIDNSDINYILELAKKNISLAKLILTKFNNSLNEELFPILDYVLMNDSSYVFNISSINNPLVKVGVIQSYMNAGNIDYVEQNISKVSLNDLLLPYKYDKTKTILEVCLEKGIILDDSQWTLIYENEIALTILFNNKIFVNEVLNGLIDDSISNEILDKMFSVQDGILLVNFFASNFEKLKFNSYFLKLSTSNKKIGLIYERYSKGKFRYLLSYLKLPINKINFNGMSIENIIYILENNKNDVNGINDYSINYILGLSKNDVSLAKLILTKFSKLINEELFIILEYVLINDPFFNFNVFSVDEHKRLGIIECYLNAENNEYVKKNISQILVYDFLLSYRYDSTKTILEVILERKMFVNLSSNQLNFILEHEDELVILFNSDNFLKNLLEELINDNIDYDTIIKLSKAQNGILLANFFANNFEKLKSNSYFLKLASSNRMIELVYVKNGLFKKSLLKTNDIFLPTYKLPDNHLYLEYVLFFYEKGIESDFSIDELDEILKFWIPIGKTEKNLPVSIEYLLLIEFYIKYHRIEPLLCLTDEQMMTKINGRTIKEYISRYIESDILSSVNKFIMHNEWDKVRGRISNLDEYILTFPYEYDKTKTILDMLLEHNILPSNDVINLLLKDGNAIISFVKKGFFIDRILNLPEEYLLFKPLLSNKTVLDTILDKDVSMIKFIKERAVKNIDLAKIIIKYDIMFFLEVEKECAESLIKNITLTDQYRLESLGIISTLINKYDITILNGANIKIIHKYLDIIKYQIKNNPNLLEQTAPVIQYQISQVMYEIIKDDPTKICFFKVNLGSEWLAKYAELARDNVIVAKHLIKMKNYEILQFLSKKTLIDVLPYAYTIDENFKGIPSMAYFEPEIMDIVRKYRPDIVNEERTQEILKIKKWMKEIMPTILIEYFGNLIDENKIIDVVNRTFFEESAMFQKDNLSLAGYWSSITDTSHILIKSKLVLELISVALHESIHNVFSKNREEKRNSGFNNIGIGINEAATEFFTQEILGSSHQNPEGCVYYNATICLRELLSLEIPGFNIDVLKNAYANNDISEIENAIDTLAGNGFFRSRLLPAFDSAIIIGSDVGDLRRAITDLNVLKQNKLNNLYCDSTLGRGLN